MPVWEDESRPFVTLASLLGGTDIDHRRCAISFRPGGSAMAPFQLKHAWIAGSVIRPHIHWIDDGRPIRWRLSYGWTSNGQPYWERLQPLVETGRKMYPPPLPGGKPVLQVTDFGGIPGNDHGPSSIVTFLLERIDDLPGDPVSVVELDFHYLRKEAGGTVHEWGH